MKIFSPLPLSNDTCNSVDRFPRAVPCVTSKKYGIYESKRGDNCAIGLITLSNYMHKMQ